MELRGKFAVVTGGGRGIGLAITRALQAAGTDVLIVGRDEAKLNAVRGGNDVLTAFAAELSKASERDRLIQHLLTSERAVDIFINNAGTMTNIDVHKDDALSLLDNELAIDLHAPIHFSMALLPHLLTRPEAALVNITSGLIYAPFWIRARIQHGESGASRLYACDPLANALKPSTGAGGHAANSRHRPHKARQDSENPAGGRRKSHHQGSAKRHGGPARRPSKGSLLYFQTRAKRNLQDDEHDGGQGTQKVARSKCPSLQTFSLNARPRPTLLFHKSNCVLSGIRLLHRPSFSSIEHSASS